jgi:hypothetical protein
MGRGRRDSQQAALPRSENAVAAVNAVAPVTAETPLFKNQVWERNTPDEGGCSHLTLGEPTTQVYAHLAVWARDAVGPLAIDPRLLRKRYHPITEGEGEPLNIGKPAPSALVEPAAMSTVEPDQPPQADPMSKNQAQYLRSLCERAGKAFDGTLTKLQASRRIDELKAFLASA